MLTAPGCIVRSYQPLSGLHRPVVVDPSAPNFQDLRLTVYCVPADHLSLQQASALCQKVGALFENQGATVATKVDASEDEDFGDDDDDDSATPDAVEPGIGLTLELRARKVHSATHPLSWAATIMSFTLVPGVTEVTFAQDVVIRDQTGFLLATDSLQGRLVTYFGFGSWGGNKLIDLLWREKEDEVVGDAASRDLSNDMYRQLSQDVFNAKLQWQVSDASNVATGAR